MFNNIGGKVKGLAVVVCCLGIITAIIYAIVAKSFLTFIIGVLSSWIGCWSLYAIGEAADASAKK